jgi:hypothetical protein
LSLSREPSGSLIIPVKYSQIREVFILI